MPATNVSRATTKEIAAKPEWHRRDEAAVLLRRIFRQCGRMKPCDFWRCDRAL
jgi:hypothetical protein